MQGWRVMITRDGDSFLRDELSIFMGYHDDENDLRMVKPINFELGDRFPTDVVPPPGVAEPTRIPTELAEALFEALAYTLTGTADVHKENERLKAELHKANSRVDSLIAAVRKLTE